MIVVSDTSPITTLLQIGRVDLLHKLYGEVLIPEAVRSELSRLHQPLPEFFQCEPVLGRAAVGQLLMELDLGEAEAIVLAKEKNADFLLIDEIDGRDAATREGLHIIGLLGVLGEAKFAGLILSVGDILREIETQTTFYISTQTKNLVLKLVGEL